MAVVEAVSQLEAVEQAAISNPRFLFHRPLATQSLLELAVPQELQQATLQTEAIQYLRQLRLQAVVEVAVIQVLSVTLILVAPAVEVCISVQAQQAPQDKAMPVDIQVAQPQPTKVVVVAVELPAQEATRPLQPQAQEEQEHHRPSQAHPSAVAEVVAVAPTTPAG